MTAPNLQVAKSVIATNLLAVLQLTLALLPMLSRQAEAAIVTTTSGLAFIPNKQFPTYCATKAFLHSWLQSLRSQMAGTAVQVLELAPPYVQTELGGAAQLTDPAAMPLAAFIAEVIAILEKPEPDRGEILVAQVKPLRWAERDGKYDNFYRMMNETRR